MYMSFACVADAHKQLELWIFENSKTYRCKLKEYFYFYFYHLLLLHIHNYVVRINVSL